jgi:hypothetical protein
VAKRFFKVYIEVDEEVLREVSDQENSIEAFKYELLWSKTSGIAIKSIIEEDDCCPEDVVFPLYITVVDGKVTEIWYDNHWGIDRLLSNSKFSVSYESH